MKKLTIPSDLQEKIYDFKDFGKKVEITSYFPLSETEKQIILDNIESQTIRFSSIFSDTLLESEWIDSKEQIKKKFQDELFDIE